MFLYISLDWKHLSPRYLLSIFISNTLPRFHQLWTQEKRRRLEVIVWVTFNLVQLSYYLSQNDSFVDVNECDETPNVCGANSTCTNTRGSFTCTCETGFEMVDGSCVGNLFLLLHFNMKDLFHAHWQSWQNTCTVCILLQQSVIINYIRSTVMKNLSPCRWDIWKKKIILNLWIANAIHHSSVVLI